MGRPKGSKNKPKVTESAPSTTVTKTDNIEYMSQSNKKRTVAEMKEWYENNTQNTQNAFKQLRDVAKTSRQTTLNSYSKDNVVSYLQNISSNENSLRNLSRYLFSNVRNTYILKPSRDFPGRLVVKTSPSNAGGTVSMPDQGAK